MLTTAVFRSEGKKPRLEQLAHRSWGSTAPPALAELVVPSAPGKAGDLFVGVPCMAVGFALAALEVSLRRSLLWRISKQ